MLSVGVAPLYTNQRTTKRLLVSYNQLTYIPSRLVSIIIQQLDTGNPKVPDYVPGMRKT